MTGKIFSIMFAVFAIILWKDDESRLLFIMLANIWSAAAYARGRS